MANETIIDREGVFYLEQVTRLVCDKKDGLGFKDFPVKVTYKTYYNSSHPDFPPGAESLIYEAVEKKLCPGKFS